VQELLFLLEVFGVRRSLRRVRCLVVQFLLYRGDQLGLEIRQTDFEESAGDLVRQGVRDQLRVQLCRVDTKAAGRCGPDGCSVPCRQSRDDVRNEGGSEGNLFATRLVSKDRALFWEARDPHVDIACEQQIAVCRDKVERERLEREAGVVVGLPRVILKGGKLGGRDSPTNDCLPGQLSKRLAFICTTTHSAFT
jgi:hypothetical protein